MLRRIEAPPRTLGRRATAESAKARDLVRASAPKKPVLIVNPKSGGGKAEQFDLVGACRAGGIEPVVFEQGEDLTSLARQVVSDGADVIGVAGGDGSQALVAAVAAEHDVSYVCVPAGTRNHFALDIGIDRNDVLGALVAFYEGSERRIDLGRVNGRVFVNNASMGDFASTMQSAVLDRPVVDQTNLQGHWDFTLKWTPDAGEGMMRGPGGPGGGPPPEGAPPPPDTLGPSIFTALQEQLGLKLEPTKAPAEVLVIDHVEKPSEN